MSDATGKPERPLSQSASAWIGRFREQNLTPYLNKWRARLNTDPRTGLILKPLRDAYAADQLSLERLAFHAGKGLKLAVNLFAPVSLLVFAASFFVPHELTEQVLRAVSVAGLIGFGTNWVAVQMLFRPRSVRPIFGQGLIPSQRNEIIRKVADEVLEKLINEEIIKKEIEDSRLISRLTAETAQEIRRLCRDPEFVRDTKQVILTYAARFAKNESFRDELTRTVEERVQHVAGTSFSNWFIGRLRGMWREPLARIVHSELDQLPDTLDRLVGEVDEALNHVPSFMEEKQGPIDAALTRIVMSLIRELDMRRVVLKQLSTVTSEQLEVGFLEFADDKLQYITLLGGILGAIGGFVILWPVWSLIGIAGLLLLLAGLDALLYKILKRFREKKSS
jgi:uncharacterized membrane-anchored protein YjiN (DUF445 family)